MVLRALSKSPPLLLLPKEVRFGYCSLSARTQTSGPGSIQVFSLTLYHWFSCSEASRCSFATRLSASPACRQPQASSCISQYILLWTHTHTLINGFFHQGSILTLLSVVLPKSSPHHALTDDTHFPPQRLSFKVRVQVGREWDPVTW